MKQKIVLIGLLVVILITGGLWYFVSQEGSLDIPNTETDHNQSNNEISPFTLKSSNKLLITDTKQAVFKNDIYGYEFSVPGNLTPTGVLEEKSFYVSHGEYDTEEYTVVHGTVFVTDRPRNNSLKDWLISSYSSNLIKKIAFNKAPELEAYLVDKPNRIEIFTENNNLLYVIFINGDGRNKEDLTDEVIRSMQESFYINEILPVEILAQDNVDWSHGRDLSSIIYTENYEDKAFRYEIKSKIIGKILEGRYSGGEVMEMSVLSLDYFDDYGGKGGPTIGDHTSSPYRAILIGDRGVINYDLANDEYAKSNFKELFKHFEVSYSEDYSVKILSYFSNIFVNSPKQYLRLGYHSVGRIPDNESMRIVGNTSIGSLYMDKEDLNKISFFYEDQVTYPTEVENSFYVFMPEQDYLLYTMPIDFNIEDVLINEGKIKIHSDFDARFGNGLYESRTRRGCSFDASNWIAILPPVSVNYGKDLEVVGHNILGDQIYSLSNNHPINIDFYGVYKKYRIDGFAADYLPPLYSFEDFVAAYPVLIWKDPFDRFVRFVREDFIPPAACEPIIYLYPEERQRVSVKLGVNVNITDSYPTYTGGWDVVASPNGALEIEGKAYPYLFWEGFSYIFPMRDEGFLVERSDVHEFFLEVLPKLGLNHKEANDFVLAWEPRFEDAPYYFITFYDKDFIDYFAPITISPKPDTIIRILMDFKPLNKPIAIKPLNITTPDRKGFTVVEWGGLIR